MKRSVLLITVILGWLASIAVSQNPPVEKVGPQVSPVQRPARRPMQRRSEPQQQLAGLQSQLKKLETEHLELIKALQEIEAKAQEEKAVKTLESVQGLRETLEAQYERETQALKGRIGRLERVVNSLEQRKLEINRIGISAPNFALKDLDGNEIRLSQYKGKVVVLEWFSPHSGPVLYHYEKKTLAGLRDKMPQQEVVWLGLVSDSGDQDRDLQRFVERYEIDWPILDDRQAKVASRAYGVTRTPQVVIIDAEGKIAYTGAIDNDPQLGKLKNSERVNYVAAALEALLVGQPVATPKSEVYGDPIQ